MRKIYVIALLTLFSSCQHRLVPSWYNVDRDHSPLSEIGNDEVTVRLENLEANTGFMVFDLELINNSDYPLQFNFRDITSYSSPYQFMEADETAAWKNQVGLQVEPALDLKEVNTIYENKLKSKKTLGVLMAIAAVGLVVYDLAEDANDFSSAEWTYADAHRSATRDAITVGSLVALDVASDINGMSYYRTVEDLAFLPDEIFMKSVIAGGDSYRGKVYINNELVNKYYRIAVPVEGTTYIFDFRKANSSERQRIRPTKY